jgi:hypothetical protein
MSNNTIPNYSKKPCTEVFYNNNNLRLISLEAETTLDTKIQNVEFYIESNHGYNADESIKDGLYKTAQELFKDFGEYFRDVKYNLHLNKKQFNFITNLLITKLEYNAETVFDAISLSNMLGNWKDIFDKANKIKLSKKEEETATNPYPFDVTEINYLIRLISMHKVKGLQPETYVFADIISKIDTITTLFKYYNAKFEFIKSDIHSWVAEFDGVTTEGNIRSEMRLRKAKELVVMNLPVEEIVVINSPQITEQSSDGIVSDAPKLKNNKKTKAAEVAN